LLFPTFLKALASAAAAASEVTNATFEAGSLKELELHWFTEIKLCLACMHRRWYSHGKSGGFDFFKIEENPDPFEPMWLVRVFGH
jgi:hypothetical protein